jgi:penicillin-binding protein 2
VAIDKDYFKTIQKGMYLVVNGSGTARSIRTSDVVIAGKTGTAQNPHGQDHSWFIAYAPYDDPKIAICVMVENAGFGATVAAPIAQRIILRYLLGLQDESEVKDSFGER